ncbi:MAG: 1-deoxy-D-xylulose-5-phosphate reductoisomerase [Spirochaetales bacterium]|nr:1-deoxy-D-xylulose-5-phosphate reductoisomerase [Spirochaetales bacterium]
MPKPESGFGNDRSNWKNYFHRRLRKNGDSSGRSSPSIHAKRRIVLLGATGSIGESTLQVIRAHSDRLELIGVAAGRQGDKLDAIAREFGVKETSLFCRDGLQGLERLACLPEADIVLVATTGTIALRPVLSAIAAGKDIALANKETLVVGGHLVMSAARASGSRVYPIDSEHNAIFQCLEGNPKRSSIKRLLLTASGGPFRETSLEALKNVTVEDALRHPNWSMGPKITVDSATMANKGLEMIEARWLFDVRPDQIDVVIHPQSIVHSMVEFCDDSIIAQLAPPSMTFAIQHILLYPERARGINETLDFTKVLSLEFRPPDEKKFPCLRLARESLDAGGFFPAAFSAANEVAVDEFLHRGLPFLAIPKVISHVLERTSFELPNNADDLIEAEAAVHTQAEIFLRQMKTLTA